MSKEKLTTLLNSLNTAITEDYINTTEKPDVEAFIRTEIETAFGITQAIKDAEYKDIDSEKLKSLYYSLSREFHPDGFRRKNPELSAILAKKDGYDRLPQAMLGEVWSEITKDRNIHLDDAPSEFNIDTYHPLYFANQKLETFGKILQESVAKSKNMVTDAIDGEAFLDELSKALKEAFPELYMYEQYPEWLQNNIYFVAFLINTAMACTAGAVFVMNVIRELFNALITYPLLDLATQSRYVQYGAQSEGMKPVLQALRIDVKNLSGEEIEASFANVMASTPEAQNAMLLQLGIVLDDYTDEQKSQLFKQYYTMIQVLQPEMMLIYRSQFEHDTPLAVIEDFIRDNEITQHTAVKLIHILQGNDFAARKDLHAYMDIMYGRIRDIQAKQLQLLGMQGFVSLSTFKKLRSIALAMKDMVSDGTQSWEDRAARTALFIAISPVLLASCAHQAFNENLMSLTVVAKMLSVEFINAPLHAYSFFNQCVSSCSDMFTPHNQPTLLLTN